MRIAVLSDIHGNRPAFEAALAAAAEDSPDAVWCLGDLVGYGAHPNECVELARKHLDLCLAGNHDMAVRGDVPLTEFSHGAAVAAGWTQDVIDPDRLEYLRDLEPANTSREVGLFHASPRDPVWEYVISLDTAEDNLDAQEHRVCLIGHSHVALSFTRAEGNPVQGEVQTAGTFVDLSKDEWLINPGSVGQPRDGDPRASWLLLDTDAWHATYRRTPYDVDAAAAAITAAGLPTSLARRLYGGQ
jgi:predicted phosphodiesterase